MTPPQKKPQSKSQSKSAKYGTVSLSPEDRARMARLFEETSSRRQEMALIVARNLGLKVGKGVQPRSRDESLANPGIILVVCDDQGNCGCYDYGAGTCGPC